MRKNSKVKVLGQVSVVVSGSESCNSESDLVDSQYTAFPIRRAFELRLTEVDVLGYQ